MIGIHSLTAEPHWGFDAGVMNGLNNVQLETPTNGASVVVPVMGGAFLLKWRMRAICAAIGQEDFR